MVEGAISKCILKDKSYNFAVRIIKFLQSGKKECSLSKQLVRLETSIGALIREADFFHKFTIAQKECSKSICWLELLHKTEYLH